MYLRFPNYLVPVRDICNHIGIDECFNYQQFSCNELHTKHITSSFIFKLYSNFLLFII